MFNFHIAEVFSNSETPLLEKAKGLEKISDPKELDKPINNYVSVLKKTDVASEEDIDAEADKSRVSGCSIEGHNGRWEVFSNMEPPLLEKAKGLEKISDPKELDKPINNYVSGLEKTDVASEEDIGAKEDKSRVPGCPRGGPNGNWDGSRGNSVWMPDREAVPKRYKPDGLTWGQILDKYGIEGIEYKDGDPDFSPISKGEVEIDDFTDDRSSNFAQADEALAKQKGCSPEDVKKWREENRYTWHECRDCKTMQKVPREVHNNMEHSGGVSEYKKNHTSEGGE